jgi:hypothetical protein
VRIFALALLLLTSPAFAQSTAIDRISGSLGQCVKQAEQGIDQIGELQKQLAAANARVKELEAKAPSSNDGH